MPTLRELGEFEAIRRLIAGLGEPADVVVGSGDDAAVVRPDPARELVLTTDAFVEGRHWLPGWMGPAEVGARLAAANLSDLAAMAARPRWALIAVGARPEDDAAELATLQQAVARALAAEGATLVGGNLSAIAGDAWLVLTLLGDVERGRAWTRFGARPGDVVAVSGSPGRAGAALGLIQALGEGARDPRWEPILDAWLRPAVRVKAAQALAATGAVTAAIDLSDGLVGDLAHLCEASGVGADLERLGPDDPLFEQAAETLGRPAESLRAAPSDDYELLLAIDPARIAEAVETARAAGATLTEIGRLTDAPGAIALTSRGRRRTIEPTGYDHFA